MRTQFRLHKLLLTVIFIFITIFFPPTASGQDETAKEQREIPSLDVIILVDESETIWNTTDTEGLRVNTVNFLIDLLSSEKSVSTHRLSIIAFGNEPYVIPFIQLDDPAAAEELKNAYAAIHAQIEPRKNEQFTDVNQALQEAWEMIVQAASPTRKPALILISDGQPTTSQITERQGETAVRGYLDETRRLLTQFGAYQYTGPTCAETEGVPLYMIGMGVDKLVETSSPEFIALYREFWSDVSARANGYYREAEQLDQMQGIGTYIFSELLCTPATPALSVRSPQVLEYQVYDDYFQIFFTVSGKENSELQARVYRPQADGSAGGTELNKDDENVSWQSNGIDYEVWGTTYTTSESWAGTWRVVLEGEGRADFSYVFFPNVTIAIDEPQGGFLPVDKPLAIRARIVDEHGQVVGAPIKDFQVDIEGEDGARKQLTLEKQGDVFVGEMEALQKTGEYSLVFYAALPNGAPAYEHKYVTLISAPWVEITEPAAASSYEPDEPIQLEAEAHLAGVASFDDVKMISTLLQDDQPIQTIELSQGQTIRQNEENIVTYSGTFQPVEQSGDYRIQTRMTAILPGGRVFEDETPPLSLSVAAPPTPTPTPTSSPTPTSTSTATSTPTATPSPTPIPIAAELPAEPVPPTAVPPTPPPPSLWTTFTTSSFCWPGLAALLLLLLLLLLALPWRRRRRQEYQVVPDKIKLLAELIHSRQESGETPYTLILGSGPAMILGSQTMQGVVEAIANGGGLEGFYKTLDGLSPVERYVMLKKQFSEAGLSSGYRKLAELIKKGYFNLIFTTNLDTFVEQALAERKVDAKDIQILVCGDQEHSQTRVIENLDPRVKIVKLHGDVESRSFAFTPSEISTVGRESEQVMRGYLGRDLIILGHGPRDYDINRALDRKGGSIWYVGQNPPAADDSIYQVMRARGTEANIISGEFGLFENFFEALHQELTRLK